MATPRSRSERRAPSPPRALSSTCSRLLRLQRIDGVLRTLRRLRPQPVKVTQRPEFEHAPGRAVGISELTVTWRLPWVRTPALEVTLGQTHPLVFVGVVHSPA